MTFILRLPAIVVLLAAVLLCLAGAFAATVVLAHLPIDLGMVGVAREDLAVVESADWIQTGLLYGAALFFLIAAVRLMRRTQAFWTWLFGFACYGGGWARDQQSMGGLEETLRGLSVQNFQPQTLMASPGDPAAQLSLLGVLLIVGLITFIVDAADRAYWDRQEA